MAISIASNSRNDIYLGSDKNLTMSVNLQAVLQDCEHAMSAQLNEMIYQVNKGMPNFDVVWNKLNIEQFNSYGRLTLLSVPNVTAVDSFISAPNSDVLNYTAVIKTIYGSGEING